MMCAMLCCDITVVNVAPCMSMLLMLHPVAACATPCVLQTGNTNIQVTTRLRTVVSLRRLQVSAGGQSPSPLVTSYRCPELVWATGRLMSPDRGFGTSCLLHCGRLTVSANSEDS